MQKHTYFIADMHLGLPLYDPAARERKVVRWLDSIKSSAAAVYILGDAFDFWWEYKYVAPRGHVRFLGKLAELTDGGVAVHFFTGNHDLWARDYLHRECGVTMHTAAPEEVATIGGKIFFLAHGDRLGGSAPFSLTLLQRIFSCRLLQRLFSMLHPRWAFAFGYAWSRKNRLAKGIAAPFRGEEEVQYRFAAQTAQRQKVDYFVFGHRHTPLMTGLPNTSAQLALLSDWITGSTYADFDGENLTLKTFE
ncbi:MAG: UDP-2,3-diacylglucosamine diphosphatase [Prevotellaceae bacterium]|jgi:UDP-2,3-diacylglucosamine hydrolase|nr:UDP-2,3-diacylglucosamine diphosphatase [Prevotellaceae bacterium]